MKLVDNLYAYVWQGNDNNSNTYLFANVLKDNKHIVVDPGHIVTGYYREPALEMLVEEMKKDGIEAEKVGLVVLTHAHRDHCESATVFREKYHALVALHEADEASYQGQGGKVDLYLEQGELELGNQNKLQLQVYHSPGHSPGHITIYWPLRKVLIAGDVIFYQSVGRFDGPGGNGWLLKESVERLASLDIEYVLCGHPYGHPGIIEGKEAVRRNFDLIKSIFF